MISFVIGGSGSGKSEYAESIVVSDSECRKKYYIATMIAYGEEGEKRVARHRSLRKGKGFETIECPTNVAACVNYIENLGVTLLLECIPNLVANEMFDSKEGENNIVERIFTDVKCLCKKADTIVIVSDNVFEDGTEYGEETIRYMKYLGEVNNKIAAIADEVTEVVMGIPVRIK